MNNDVLFSSASCEWATPQDLFDSLDAEFHFDLDACANTDNAKCTFYFDRHDDGLAQNWSGSIWCNPPYGRGVGAWVEKAYMSSLNGSTVVMLLPARTDTKWFHDFIYGKAEIRFLRGRLKFGVCSNPAPFPSMIVVFRGC